MVEDTGKGETRMVVVDVVVGSSVLVDDVAPLTSAFDSLMLVMWTTSWTAVEGVGSTIASATMIPISDD